MKPVVTVAEMRDIDKSAPLSEATLIDRAGWHVARDGKENDGWLLRPHVVVIAGPGNNGADGKLPPSYYKHGGARVKVLSPDTSDEELSTAFDLVIDAAFGTGFHGEYNASIDGSARSWLSIFHPVSTAILALHVPAQSKLTSRSLLQPINPVLS